MKDAYRAAVADTVVVMAKERSAATGVPRDVLTRERLSEMWRVNWLDR